MWSGKKCIKNKQKKKKLTDGKIFFIKLKKQMKKIIFVKFAPKRSAQNGQRKKGPQQNGPRQKDVLPQRSHMSET